MMSSLSYRPFLPTAKPVVLPCPGFTVRVSRYGFIRRVSALLLHTHFNPKYDTLYVPLEKWDEFFLKPFDRIEKPDLLNRAFEIPAPKITRIAVSQALLQHKVGPLAYLFEW